MLKLKEDENGFSVTSYSGGYLILGLVICLPVILGSLWVILDRPIRYDLLIIFYLPTFLFGMVVLSMIKTTLLVNRQTNQLTFMYREYLFREKNIKYNFNDLERITFGKIAVVTRLRRVSISGTALRIAIKTKGGEGVVLFEEDSPPPLIDRIFGEGIDIRDVANRISSISGIELKVVGIK